MCSGENLNEGSLASDISSWQEIWSFPKVLLGYLASASGFVALYAVFCFVPDEQVMGAVQRIFYFHVASAMSCYVMLGLLFMGSLAFMITGDDGWDRFANAASSVAFLLATAVLATGMIWGHSAWNTWWRWEPRLVSFLVLWLILFSYFLLRSFTEGDERQARFAAVLGVISAINVPIVVFSIKLLSHREQLHPQVLAKQGLGDPRYVYGLMITIIAMCLISSWIFLLKKTSLFLASRVLKLEREINGVLENHF